MIISFGTYPQYQLLTIALKLLCFFTAVFLVREMINTWKNLAVILCQEAFLWQQYMVVMTTMCDITLIFPYLFLVFHFLKIHKIEKIMCL